jgi:carbamoyl-phosphate synthase large subunit
VPRATDADYLPVLKQLVEEHKIDLIIVTRPIEMLTVARDREKVGTRTFLPKAETLELCNDKIASYAKWKAAGVPVPPSMRIYKEEDLKKAFKDFGPELWLRDIGGAGGKGSLPVSDMETAVGWINIRKGWGSFMAARRLTSRTVTWESIWRNGKLVAAQGRERHYWEFAALTPSGVTGITGSGETVSDPVVDDIAQRAIKAVDPSPNGLMGVDMTYNQEGVPCVTEINGGRYMNGGVVLYSGAGISFPYLTVQAGMDELPKNWTPKINPLPPGIVCVRGMDVEPVLLKKDKIKQAETELAALRKRAAG